MTLGAVMVVVETTVLVEKTVTVSGWDEGQVCVATWVVVEIE